MNIFLLFNNLSINYFLLLLLLAAISCWVLSRFCRAIGYSDRSSNAFLKQSIACGYLPSFRKEKPKSFQMIGFSGSASKAFSKQFIASKKFPTFAFAIPRSCQGPFSMVGGYFRKSSRLTVTWAKLPQPRRYTP